MASLSTDKNGNRTIQLVCEDKKRRAIRLGKVEQDVAEQIRLNIEHLVRAKKYDTPLTAQIATWVQTLPPKLADRLHLLGVIAKPKHQRDTEKSATLLGNFTQSYMDRRTDIKELSMLKLKTTRKYLIEFFGADKPLVGITPGDADDFRAWLLNRPMGENTVRKHICIAKQYYNAAKRRRMIIENPFEGLKSTVMPNRQREFFVTQEMAEKVLNACPDAEWRLIFALSRYGGLRCPSEHLALRWEDIHWGEDRITVPSPKTEHHTGRESRIIPIFPELRPYLEDVRELATADAEFVITRYRSATANLRTQLDRIIKRAGLKPWPKRFQNLRSTRQTELAENWPAHVVCAWMGNTKAVAERHYLQVTEDHFAKAVHKAVQQAPASESKPRKPKESPIAETPKFQESAAICDQVNTYPVGPEGLEQGPKNAIRGQRDGSGGAQSGAVDASTACEALRRIAQSSLAGFGSELEWAQWCRQTAADALGTLAPKPWRGSESDR